MFEFFRQPGGDDARDETRVRLEELIATTDRHAAESPREQPDDIPDERTPEATSDTRPPDLAGRGGRLVRHWVPASVAGKAVSRGGRKLAVLGFAAAVAVALLTGTAVLADDPSSRPAPPPRLPVAGAKPATASTTVTPTSSGARTVVVSVVGNVATPGLVTLPAGARVAEALRAAGGTTDRADRRTVNLARRLVDGEQLYVGVPAPAGATQPSGRTSASGPSTVNLNTAGATGLQSLPGVGEVTANRILEWRAQHGSFDTVEQLRRVDGIGAKTLADLRELVRVR